MWIDVRANGTRQGGGPAAGGGRAWERRAGGLDRGIKRYQPDRTAADWRRLSDVMGVTARHRSGRLRQICFQSAHGDSEIYMIRRVLWCVATKITAQDRRPYAT